MQAAFLSFCVRRGERWHPDLQPRLQNLEPSDLNLEPPNRTWNPPNRTLEPWNPGTPEPLEHPHHLDQQRNLPRVIRVVLDDAVEQDVLGYAAAGGAIARVVRGLEQR
jgi:hypothetical protein